MNLTNKIQSLIFSIKPHQESTVSAKQASANTKTGRNDLCPCGSGKKFKACCLIKNQPAPAAIPDVSSLLQQAWQAVARRDVAGTLIGFRAVLKLDPHHAQALAGLGQALCWQDQVREGLGYLRQAAAELEKEAIKTRDIRFTLELAEQLHHWGDLETSLRLARLAVRLAPDSPAANNNLGLYLNRMNRPEEALPYVRKACQLLPNDPACNNLLAILESRQGQLQSACERFERVIALGRDDRQTARAWQELAGVLDKLGEYERAFDACQQAKTMQQNLPEFRAIDQEQIFRNIARNKAGFDRGLLRRWGHEDFADDLPAPIFLMGFLRSGTTLTERVLGTHPLVFTSDENSLVNGLVRELGRVSACGEDVPAGLRKIDIEAARKLRKLYWQRVEHEYGSEALSKRFIDKVALNSIDIGFISAIFPEAKILFALRDPRDVCLSCYTQSFQPATGTINMLSWQGTARQYSALMGLWLHVREDLAPEYLELRYEDTVGDFENTFRRVFALLGLDWVPEVAEFHTQAKGRFIATPSFAAVSQPIYQSAVARWRHYEKHIAELLPTLEPYLRAFGYE